MLVGHDHRRHHHHHDHCRHRDHHHPHEMVFIILSTDIQIQEEFFLGALASLIHVEGVSVISRLKIASKRALYCFIV